MGEKIGRGVCVRIRNMLKNGTKVVMEEDEAV
jgi:hypothetical protein